MRVWGKNTNRELLNNQIANLTQISNGPAHSIILQNNIMYQQTAPTIPTAGKHYAMSKRSPLQAEMEQLQDFAQGNFSQKDFNSRMAHLRPQSNSAVASVRNGNRRINQVSSSMQESPFLNVGSRGLP